MDTKKMMAWFIIILMVLSIAGFIGGSILTSPDNSVTQQFNEHTFRRENNLWSLTINGQKYGLFYLPQEVQSITLPLPVAEWRSVEKVHLLDESTTNGSVFASSISLLQGVLYANGVRLQEACLSEEQCTKDVPIVTCATPALVIRDAAANTTESTLSSDDKCLIVSAPSISEAEKVSERIIYEFLTVIR